MTDATPTLDGRSPSQPLGAAAAPGATRSRFARLRRSRAPGSPRRIALFGLFGCGNSGNDGSLEAMLAFLRQILPGADLACISAAPDRAAQRYGLVPIPLRPGRPAHGVLRTVDSLLLGGPHRLAGWVRAVLHARHFDALIIPGTGILEDLGDRLLGLPAALFGWCLAARLCGSRIAFVSIGAGPIDRPLSRWLMKKAAAMAHYRSYRDAASKAYMQSIGFDARNDAVYPDLAFKLPVPPAAPRRSADQPLTVAVGVMGYYGWRHDDSDGRTAYAAYIGKIRQFVLWLLDQDFRVQILMGDEVDWQAAADVVTRVATARPDLPDDRLRTEPMGSLHDLMRQIAGADVVVATRFHNLVCALKLGKPTMSISYASKNDVLMADMGLGQFCQSIQNLDLARLIEQFCQLMADRQRYESNIREVGTVFQRRLALQDWILAARVIPVASEARTDPDQHFQAG